MEALLRQQAHDTPNGPIAPEQEADCPVVDSVDLMNGARELRIRHGESLYRLRLTASDKLILTK
jgi:hemin uptake protein HemP